MNTTTDLIAKVAKGDRRLLADLAQIRRQLIAKQLAFAVSAILLAGCGSTVTAVG